MRDHPNREDRSVHVHVCGPDPAVVCDFWAVIDAALTAHGARSRDGPTGTALTAAAEPPKGRLRVVPLPADRKTR